MRGLSRAEIDALVRRELQGEAAAAPGSPPPAGRTRRTRLRTTSIVGGVVLLAWLVLGGHLQHAASTALPTYSRDGLPSHPTRYADGSYRFIRMQPDNAAVPVGYNPCKFIDVEINYLDATPSIRADVEEVMGSLLQVSGLHLRYVGASGRNHLSAPDGRILVSFTRQRSDATMNDAIAGRGGSYSYTSGLAGQTLYYVGGVVTLNADTFTTQPHGAQLLILAHEFGHALGLQHAPGAELMNADPWPYGLHHYAHGDLTGLAKLGQLPCR